MKKIQTKPKVTLEDKNNRERLILSAAHIEGLIDSWWATETGFGVFLVTKKEGSSEFVNSGDVEPYVINLREKIKSRKESNKDKKHGKARGGNKTGKNDFGYLGFNR